MYLNSANLHLEHTIESLAGQPEMQRRLIELGFVRGEVIKILGCSLFGSPLFIEVKGAVMALRASEAQCIQIRE